MSDTTKSLQAQLDALKAENEALKRKAAGSLKIGEKGTVCLYGMGRFPVALYPEQWGKLLALKGEIEAFIEANKAKLSYKQAA